MMVLFHGMLVSLFVLCAWLLPSAMAQPGPGPGPGGGPGEPPRSTPGLDPVTLSTLATSGYLGYRAWTSRRHRSVSPDDKK